MFYKRKGDGKSSLLRLVLFGGGTRRQFAEEAEQGCCGLLVGEVLERHRSGEVRRGGVEANAHKIFIPPGGERIDDRAQFDGPIFLGGQNDGARTAYGPGAVAGQNFSCFFRARLLWSRVA